MVKDEEGREREGAKVPTRRGKVGEEEKQGRTRSEGQAIPGRCGLLQLLVAGTGLWSAVGLARAGSQGTRTGSEVAAVPV